MGAGLRFDAPATKTNAAPAVARRALCSLGFMERLVTQWSKFARSFQSMGFDVRLRSLALPDLVPKRSAIKWSGLGAFVSNVVVLEPKFPAGQLLLEYIGSKLAPNFGADIGGSDYLDIVAPSARRSALDNVAAGLAQQCGFWSVAPARTNDGQTLFLEATCFPVFGEEPKQNRILIYVQAADGQDIDASLRIIAIQAPIAWQWIDLGHGVPAVSEVQE